jgi:hypothetical protein
VIRTAAAALVLLWAAAAQADPALAPPPAMSPVAEPAALDGGAAPPVVLPAAAPCTDALERPDEIYGKVHLERAVQAKLAGQTQEARAEAQAGLRASPTGRYAQSTQALLDEVDASPASEGSTGARVELAIGSTAVGFSAGTLAAVALDASDKGTVGLMMLGTGAGLGLSLGLTAGRPVRPALAPMLELGAMYGTSTVLLGEAIGGGDDLSAPTALGMVGGALAGVAVGQFTPITAGDAAAGQFGYFAGGGLPTLLAFTFGVDDDHTIEAVALVGSSVGMVAGPLLNEQLRWSRARWTLVGLGGGVGLLFGLGGAVLSNSSGGQSVSAWLLAGSVVGVGVTAFATRGFAPEPSSPPGQALLQLHRDGRWALHDPLEAVGLTAVPRARGPASLGVGLTLAKGEF